MLQFVANVTSFLLNDLSNTCFLFSLKEEDDYRVSDSSATLINLALLYFAPSFGLDLPCVLAIIDGLSMATAFMLRLI